MHAETDRFTRPRTERGPALYYGYCADTKRYRMMDLPDYVTNVQQGLSQWMTDAQTAYADAARGAWGRGAERPSPAGPRQGTGGCGCGCDDCRRRECHCECCVCEADVLIHARCGEVRRIPVTFANDTRRERPVTLELERFVTAGGRDLQWPAQLSATSFTLRPCDEQTVVVTLAIRCRAEGDEPEPVRPGQTPAGHPGTVTAAAAAVNVAGAAAATPAATAVVDRAGRVDRCEVGYATLRADGCLVRPVILAVAVLPDDCDAYHRPCGCGCCH
jgi:hypothetical protein